MRIKTANIIDYLLYAIFFGIFLELPNIIAERMRNSDIPLSYTVSTNAIIAVLAYLYIIRGLKRQQFIELSNRYAIIFLLMLVSILISTINAYNTNLGFLYLRNYFSFYLLCILILWRLKTKGDFLHLFKVIFFGGTIFGVFTLLFTNISHIAAYLHTYQAGDVAYRLTVLDINANTLGYLFAVLFIIKVSLLQKKSKFNFFLIASGILDIFFILMTFSRGVFCVLFVEVFVYLILKFDFFKFLGYLSTVALLAYIIADKYFHTHFERFMTLKHLLPNSSGTRRNLAGALLEQRVYNLIESFNIGMQHFFCGVGGYNLNDFIVEGSHNQFLNIFVENGIFTFMIYIMFLVIITVKLLAMSINFRRQPRFACDLNISACLAAVMCGSFIQGMVSYLRYDFWVICGISIAWIIIAKKQTTMQNSFTVCQLSQGRDGFNNE